jgi:peptide/nickel transport system permease protein
MTSQQETRVAGKTTSAPWVPASRPSLIRSIWHSLRHRPVVIGAFAALLIVIFMAISAPYLAPQSPNEVHLLDRLNPPGFVGTMQQRHYLGTDHLGRDLLSRLMYGSRISLMVGVTTVLIGGVLGLLLGMISGYYGGQLDDVIMRVADIQLAFPSILLYIAVLAVLGPGASNARILRLHVLPNIIAPLIVVASFAVANNIIAEASLSFLGLGVPPSVPTWGAMLAESLDYLRDAWWPVTFPGLAIMLTVLSINIIGDWLRDYLDPRLKI